MTSRKPQRKAKGVEAVRAWAIVLDRPSDITSRICAAGGRHLNIYWDREHAMSERWTGTVVRRVTITIDEK